MKNKILFVAVAVVLFFISEVFAEVKPSSLFCESMVLQRGVEIPVWGTAWPKEKISVMLNKQVVNVTADASGNWMARLPKQKAGGPYSLEIAGDNIITYNDVYVGDVWLCSGQSNMDMTVAKEDRYWCGVNNEAEEVANANYPQIRVFDVDYAPKNTVQTSVTGKWEVCSPKTVGHFSAVAITLFFPTIFLKIHMIHLLFLQISRYLTRMSPLLKIRTITLHSDKTFLKQNHWSYPIIQM